MSRTVYTTANRVDRRKLKARLGRKSGVVIVQGDRPADGPTLDERPCGHCYEQGRGLIPMGLHPKPNYYPCPEGMLMTESGPVGLLVEASAPLSNVGWGSDKGDANKSAALDGAAAQLNGEGDADALRHSDEDGFWSETVKAIRADRVARGGVKDKGTDQSAAGERVVLKNGVLSDQVGQPDSLVGKNRHDASLASQRLPKPAGHGPGKRKRKR